MLNKLKIFLLSGMTFLMIIGCPTVSVSEELTVPNSRVIGHNNDGVRKMNEGDYEGAISEFNEALGLDSNYELAYGNRALANRYIGNKQGAIKDYTEALRITPDQVMLIYSRGLLEHELGDNVAALSDFKVVLSRDKEIGDKYWHFARGFIEAQKGDYKSAIEDYNLAIKECSSEPDFLRNQLHYESLALYYHDQSLAKRSLSDLKGAQEDIDQEKLLRDEAKKAHTKKT